MIYNVNTRELRTDAGKLLKKLDCPLNKDWAQLTVLPSDQTRRHCESCHKTVVHLAGKSDEEIETLFHESPECCVFIERGPRVRILGSRISQPAGQSDDPCPYRRIHTARGAAAINQEVRKGFRALVKKVVPSSRLSSWMAVYQNEETGEVKTVGDRRHPPESPWKQIIKPFSFYPYSFEHRIAAYLLPPDLKMGERVFLVDLIEDRVGIFGNQNHTLRLDCAYAIWTGKDFKVQWSEYKDAEQWIG